MSHWTIDSHFTLELFAIKEESVLIPIGNHKRGELGVIYPFPAFYTEKATGKSIKYFLQPFVVMSHVYEDAVQVKFW